MASRTRSHLVYEGKFRILSLYDLEGLEKTERAIRVEYLLENDRFICHPDKYDVRYVEKILNRMLIVL